MTLGERLREARVRAELTLDSAASQTRIKRDYLEALESMDPRGLPSRAYAVGYLRTYSAFLGLDAAGCIDQFKREVECETGRSQPTAPQEKREIRLPRGTIGTAAILIAVVAMAGWYGHYISQRETLTAASQPMEALISAEANAEARIPRAPARPDEIWAGLPGPRSAGAVVLEAGAPVHLEVRDASGRILVSRLLEPGDIYRAPDEPGLVISASDAGAVLIRAAGRPLGALGERGEALDNAPVSEFLLAAMSGQGGR
ncbi:helix-turn-helix domain-containing protein [Alkalicaulis satelles]|nr:helix-turn-helix domain-containing protein [Alkalicaulis satelles]